MLVSCTFVWLIDTKSKICLLFTVHTSQQTTNSPKHGSQQHDPVQSSSTLYRSWPWWSVCICSVLNRTQSHCYLAGIEVYPVASLVIRVPSCQTLLSRFVNWFVSQLSPVGATKWPKSPMPESLHGWMKMSTFFPLQFKLQLWLCWQKSQSSCLSVIRQW